MGENPPSGAQIYYSLTGKAERVSLRVLDIDGTVVAQLPGRMTEGLHRVTWDLTRPGTRPAAAPPTRRGGGQPPRRPAPAGAYRVVLTVDGQEMGQTFRLEADPTDVSWH